MTSSVVHLELHTHDLRGARAFYSTLLGWRGDEVSVTGRTYLALDLAGCIGGGIVECGTTRPLWLPYVEVGEVEQATARARELGAKVLLGPREGPAGWRSVVADPAAGEVALWQAKRRSDRDD
jgi:predicted enzyme related to lactoylglutathione lyase